MEGNVMKRIDAFLSGIIQKLYNDALVIVHDENTPEEMWVLKRTRGESAILGRSFKEARKSIEVLMSAARAT